MKLCFEFKTPEEALEYLFNEAEQSCLKNGYAHVWHRYKSINGNSVAGANRIKREDLIGRNYNVNWCNDTVSIEFLDEIFMNKITGRSFPEKTTCCIVRFPTNQ
jgi:hypothetical protein